MDTLPVIDLSGLWSDEPARRRAVAAALGSACRDVGFFYAVGHGLPDGVLDGAFAAARRLFALPAADKEALSITRSPHNRGYVSLEGERLDTGAPADRKEAFNIGLDLPPDHPEVVAGRPFRGVNVWPAMPGWREAVLACFDGCWEIGRRLHRGFALDLGLDEAFFEDKLDAPLATLRLLHYPPAAAGMAPGQPGAGEHTDYGNVTLLATDGVPGLQVRRRDGTWIDAPHRPGAFVCNIGDCLMRWTNDVYVSTPHRVAVPDRDRWSIAFFLDPNPDAVIEALPGCRGPHGAAKYPPTTGADYLKARLDATYDFRRGD